MKPSPEIEALIGRYLEARREGDFEKVRNMFSESEYLRLIGSDKDEWIHGYDTVVKIVGTHWDKLDYDDREVLRLEAFEHGDSGWAAIETTQMVNEELEHVTRSTFTFILEGGVWKIVQAHHSVPVPDEELGYSVELTKTLADLLVALPSEVETGGIDTLLGTSTIVFTDVVASTEMSHTMGDREWSQVIGDHLSLLSQIAEAEGGSVVKTLGDGAMFAFESASSALSAASRIQREMAESDLSVRIGAHSGDVVRDRDDYIGLTVNKAARVAAAAEGGQILVSASTAGMVNPSEFRFGDPLTVELKGIEGTHVLQPLLLND